MIKTEVDIIDFQVAELKALALSDQYAFRLITECHSINIQS